MEDAFKAAEYGLAGGALSGQVIGGIFHRADKATRGGFGARLTEIARAGGVGAAENAVNQVVENLIASNVVRYDPERDVFKGTGDAAGVGFTGETLRKAIGGLFGGGR